MILLLRSLSSHLVCTAVLVGLFLEPGLSLAQEAELAPVLESASEDELSSGEKLTFPAVIKLGAAGNHVWEIQTTLNSRLGSRSGNHRIHLGDDYHITLEKAGSGKGMRRLTTPDGELRIRGDWEPGYMEGDEFVAGEPPGEGEHWDLWLQLPDEPLHPAGIYGEQTYALVMMFQIQNNLQPTGELDAVTLGLLEPIIPASPILRPIMRKVEVLLDDRKGDDDYALYVKRYTAVIAALLIAVVAVVAYVATFVIFRIVMRMATAKVVSKPAQLASRLVPASNSPWFAPLREEHFFSRLAHFAPALLICLAAGIFPANKESSVHAYPYIDTFGQWNTYVWRAGMAYLAFAFTLVGLAYVNACEGVFRRLQGDGEQEGESNEELGDDNRALPATSMSGIATFAWRTVVTCGIVLICAAILGRSPMYLVGGLGVFTAVIMLVFRDSLLGFVASVQMVVHKMIEVGDWIEMPNFLADGVVEQISLSTIKVKNFDNTITNIPTHVVLSNSFRNFRNMHLVGGRRIKRSLFIDLHSINICTPEMIERFRSIELISDYIQSKENELSDFAQKNGGVTAAINSRRLTNVGTFCAYVEAYLDSRVELHAGDTMTCLVRQLQPLEKGLPIEIYAFCRETSLVKFEAIQSDIFDHLLSVLPEFELRPFQEISEFPKPFAVPELHSRPVSESPQAR